MEDRNSSSYESIQQIPNTNVIDIVIVSTQADIRSEITKQILSKFQVNNILFEKPLCQSINQLDSIINLQGDMPIIDPLDISKVNIPLLQGFDIGTLVTELNHNQVSDFNITKAKIKWIRKKTIGQALDFYKSPVKKNEKLYHHVGIYSFRYETLKKFVSLPPSINEIDRKLEQWRALDAKMTIGVSYVKGVPISVDTKEDLIHVDNIINNKS